MKNTLRKVADYAELAFDVLDFLHKLSGSSLAPPQFVAIVRSVLEAVKGFQDGRLTKDDVEAAMGQLEQNIAKNDADADAALRARFDKDDDQ